MPGPVQKTIRELVNDISLKFAGSDLYYGHGTDNAFDESAYLVFTLLDIPFDIEDEKLNQVVDQEILAEIEGLANTRVSEKKPVAYLVNKAWFAGIEFYVDDRVLIPRSPIAELITGRFSPWISPHQRIRRVLDIGTGSGCIGIAMAIEFQEAMVDIIDISPDALEVAKINVKRHQLHNRIEVIQSNLFDNIKQKKYDVIIANPPYVDEEEIKHLPAEFLYEPAIGFKAGKDGLDIVRNIISKSGQYLQDDGFLVVEVGTGQERVDQAFPNLPFTWLEFEQGGEGVFLLTAKDLLAAEGTEIKNNII